MLVGGMDIIGIYVVISEDFKKYLGFIFYFYFFLIFIGQFQQILIKLFSKDNKMNKLGLDDEKLLLQICLSSKK